MALSKKLGTYDDVGGNKSFPFRGKECVIRECEVLFLETVPRAPSLPTKSKDRG